MIDIKFRDFDKETKTYTLHYLYRGWDEELSSDNLDELICKARELIIKNTGKPLIITNDKKEIVRELTPRLHSFNEPKYSKDFKDYKESMKELDEGAEIVSSTELLED